MDPDLTFTPRNVTFALEGFTLHWREIGKSLEVPKEELQKIQMEVQDPQQYLYQVILYWTMNNSKCTWSIIRSVISSLKEDYWVDFNLTNTKLRAKTRRVLNEDYYLKFDTYVCNLKNIQQRATSGEHVKEKIPRFDICYEDSWLEMKEFEIDYLKNGIKEQNLKDVIKVITDSIPLKWKQIGIQLNVPKARLDIIAHNNPRVEDRIIEMIYEWYNSDVKHTWHTLIDALQNVQSYEVADAMKKIAPIKQKNSITEFIDNLVDPVEISELKENKSGLDQENHENARKKEEREHEQQATIQDIRRLLRVSNQVSDQDIIKDLPKHIKRARHLKQEDSEELVTLIERLVESKHKYAGELRNQAEKLQKQLKMTSIIGTKLHENKQNLESAKSKLNRNKEKIKQKLQSVNESDSHYEKYKVLNQVLREKLENQEKLEHVVSKIEQIERDLEFVNADYKVISDDLSTCKSELEHCIEEYSSFRETLIESIPEIPYLSRSYFETFIGVTGTAAGLTFVGLSAVYSGMFGLLVTGYMAYWTIDWTRAWTAPEVNHQTKKCSEILGIFVKELEETKSKLEEVKKFTLEANLEVPWRTT